ncbi:MAG: nucleotide exchange factor GrpE [Pirellulales bacterium]|nr:nucleotide exchange factor GrpE [Pirellulales bacterium]
MAHKEPLDPRKKKPDTPPADNPPNADAPPAEPQGAPEDGAPEAQGIDEILAEEDFAEMAALKSELEDAKDRALRLAAEMENYRKRVARQVEEERRFAHVPLFRDLLPVADNLGRAIEAAEKNSSGAGLLEGVKLVLQQLCAVFEKYDCREIEALHAPFDPNLHQAVSQQPSGEFPPGTVIQVVQAGFQAHDRVVRPSQVIVSAAPPEETSENEE